MRERWIGTGDFTVETGRSDVRVGKVEGFARVEERGARNSEKGIAKRERKAFTINVQRVEKGERA